MKTQKPFVAFPPRSQWPIWLIIAVAALIYGLRNPQYRTGYFNDDALYVIAARDFWNPTGDRSALLRPDFPFPGLSVVLAPVATLIRPHWTSLEWLSILATVFSVILLSRWAKRSLTKGESIAVVALFALNPLVGRLSGVVMPTPYYTMVVIASFLTLGVLLEKPTWKNALVLGFMAGWGSLIRPEGAVLLAGIIGALALQLRVKDLLRVLIFPVVFWLPLFLFVAHRRAASGMEYGGDLAALASYWRAQGASGIQFIGPWLRMFVFDALVPLPPSYVQIPLPVMAVINLLCLVVMGAGVRSLWRASPRERPMLVGVGIYGGLYGAVHFFWHVTAPRYAIPLLPFILLFMVRGMNHLFSSIRNHRIWVGVTLGFVLLFYAYRNGMAIHESLWAPDSMKSPPWRSLAWLKQNTPADAQVISGIASSVDLYANRRALTGITASNVEYFLDQSIYRHLQYIVDRNIVFLASGLSGTDNPNSLWSKKRMWIAHYPQLFQLLYVDPMEQTTIYRIVPGPGFDQAYEILKTAAVHYHAGRDEEALRLFRQVLNIYPKMGTAANYLGALYLKRMDLANAERAFLKTIELLPDYPDAMLNLATVYRMEGQIEHSEDYVQRAEEVSEMNGEKERISQGISTLRRKWDQQVAMILLDTP